MALLIPLAPDYTLLLRPWALYAGLAILLLAAWAVVSVARSRRRVAALSAAACCVGIATVLAGSVLVPARAYAHVLGAYQAAPTPARQHALAERWDPYHEEITVLDWLLLSRQWGVCHGLWSQTGCTPTPAAEAQGVARGLITRAAHGG